MTLAQLIILLCSTGQTYHCLSKEEQIKKDVAFESFEATSTKQAGSDKHDYVLVMENNPWERITSLEYDIGAGDKILRTRSISFNKQ